MIINSRILGRSQIYVSNYWFNAYFNFVNDIGVSLDFIKKLKTFRLVLLYVLLFQSIYLLWIPVQVLNLYVLGPPSPLLILWKQAALLENLTWLEEPVALKNWEWPLAKRQKEAKALSCTTTGNWILSTWVSLAMDPSPA